MTEKVKKDIFKYGIVSPFKLNYEDRLIAFLDILGFSNMVCKGQDNDVEFIINLIPDMLKTHRANVLRDDLQITQVSDSIIMSVKAEVDDILKDLFNICIIAVRLQNELALNGYYMRGGITVGKLIHESQKNLIVGPAFIDAYNLESKKCIVPRIIIDDKVNEFYDKNYEQLKNILNDDFAQHYNNGNLIKNYPENHPLSIAGTEIFIDYVSSIVGRERYAGMKGSIREFFENIEISLENALEPKVALKYQWLAKYALEEIDEWEEWHDAEGRKCIERIREMLTEKENGSSDKL